MEGVTCLLCPRHCLIGNGKRGFCGVRGNKNGKIVSLTYGKFSAINLDPIEKKPLYHVYPGSKTLSLGSVGCNLRCPWCQNFGISREYKTNSLTLLSPEDLLQLCLERGIDTVSFTYNEPLLNYEYIKNSSKLLKENSIDTYLVTAGYIDSRYYDIADSIKAINIDLKSFSPETYRDYIKGELEPVLEAIVAFNKRSWIELTTLVIPGLNDSIKEIEAMGRWVLNNIGDSIPIHLSAFYPTYKMTDRGRTEPEKLINLRELLIGLGLNFVYTGNIHDPTGSSTYCPRCNFKVVERLGFKAISSLGTNGECPNCHNLIPGLFGLNK